MQLMMYLGNDLIESVTLDNERVPVPGYLGSFKRMLKTKYRELILQSKTAPDFLVIPPVPAHLNAAANDYRLPSNF
jgi:hypothetical protein